MNIKLGIAPIAWSNDDMPELGGDTPIEKCLEETRLAGYTGIELGGKFPRNVGIIKFLLNKFNLSLPGGWYGSLLRKRDLEDEWGAMQDQVRLLKDINSSVFIFADVSDSIQGEADIPLSNRPQLKDNEWREYCTKISEIANRLNDIGLPMSYHPHMGTIIQSDEDINRLIELTNDKTFILFDTGHLFFAQTDYISILKKFISRINHIHCKDVRREILDICIKNNMSFRNSFLKGIFTVPGDGFIDYDPILKILYDNKYQDWLVVEAEQDPIKANPFDYAKIGYKYLFNLSNQNGYNIKNKI